jgi:hypothetical protein
MPIPAAELTQSYNVELARLRQLREAGLENERTADEPAKMLFDLVVTTPLLCHAVISRSDDAAKFACCDDVTPPKPQGFVRSKC